MIGPPVIPDHTLLRPIGRGSYGEVWLARNVMGVLRAVKIVERRQFDSHRPYDREFAGIQRYEPVSRQADGLVHVLHVGRNEAEDYFYYVMELADGMDAGGGNAEGRERIDPAQEFNPATYQPRTLRSELRQRRRLPVADCLRVALDVVSGLAQLHQSGLVHRDVKPGNIIFVNGRAKLADIGLVSLGSEGRTFVGTEGYIPPEGPGAATADLYALGMALYEATTGYPPEEFPKVPTEWFAEETGTEAIEFHEIVLKACEGARERRYESAEQMQADLALLQSGQSVRHVRMLERRAARTQRLAWAAGLIVVSALAVALIAHWRAGVAEQMRLRESAFLFEAQDARQKESQARSRAEEAEHDARQQLNVALFEQARALVLSKEIGHRTRALDAVHRATAATNKVELRRVAFAALGLPDLQLDHEITLPPATTLFQPDPKFEFAAVASGKGAVTICSLPTLEVVATLPPSTNREAFVALWSSDRRFLAVKRQHDGDGVRSDWEVWHLASTQRVVTIKPDVARGSVTFHPHRPVLLAGHGGGRVTEWDLEEGRLVREFRFPNTPHVLLYSPDGRRIATSYLRDSKWKVAFHDAANPDQFLEFDHPDSIEFGAWHPHGRWFNGTAVRASEWSRGVHLIDPHSGAVTTLGQHKIKTALGEFTADGDYLVTGGWDREIIFWDLRTSERAFTLAGTAYTHTWSADGARCAVVLPNLTVQFFRFKRPNYRSLSGNPGLALLAGWFSPNGQWLAVRDERRLCVWDLEGNGPPTILPVPNKTTVFFSPDSTELFIAPDEFTHRGHFQRCRLRPAAGAGDAPQVELLPVRVPEGLLRASLAADEIIMTSSEGVRFVARTNLASGEERFVRMPGGVGMVSPDGQWLAMLYSFSASVGVYRLPEVREVARLETQNRVGFVTFSPDSQEMLVVNRSGAEWYDTSTWRRTRLKPGAPVSGSYAFYTPDGAGIWMVTHFRNAALLDRRTLEPLLPLPNNVLPLAISPDGRQLAVSVDGRRVQLWNMEALRADLSRLELNW